MRLPVAARNPQDSIRGCQLDKGRLDEKLVSLICFALPCSLQMSPNVGVPNQIGLLLGLVDVGRQFGPKISAGERPVALSSKMLTYFGARVKEAQRRRAQTGEGTGVAARDAREYEALLALGDVWSGAVWLRVTGDRWDDNAVGLDLRGWEALTRLELHDCSVVMMDGVMLVCLPCPPFASDSCS